VYSPISVIEIFITTLAITRLYVMFDRSNISDAHNEIVDSVSEATFESFRILQNKEQRRKSTSLHCGFMYSVKTTLK